MGRIIEIDEGGVTGTWVDHEDTHPQMNVFGRRWMTKDGDMAGIFYPDSPPPRAAYEKGLMWLFPEPRPAAEMPRPASRPARLSAWLKHRMWIVA